jgi:5-methylcytosine-specific restriction endonuclease McrA
VKRTPIKKTAKAKTPSWYRKKCVLEAKRIAKKRDNYTCQKCGKKPERIEGSHIFPEGTYHGMSANPDNIKSLCSYCHIWWWHSEPTESGQWFRDTFPERYERLRDLSRTTIKMNWEEELKRLKEL